MERIIDFDARFQQRLAEWIEQNRRRYPNPDDMENDVPDVYFDFLQTPADWLDGATPQSYFDRYEDADELCALLCEYSRAGVPVPDPLLDRLVTLGDERALTALATDGAAPPDARMTAVELLRQLESRLPMVDYLRWQVERAEDADLMDNALESLRLMGLPVVKPAKIAFAAADDEGKEALLDVLCDYPGDPDVFAFALKGFKTRADKRALYAGYLAKLDDDHALEALMDAAEADDVSYIDFIEIRSAIERLGGEAPVRDFSRDPSYIALRRAEKQQKRS